jgi:hypothetical protein
LPEVGEKDRLVRRLVTYSDQGLHWGEGLSLTLAHRGMGDPRGRLRGQVDLAVSPGVEPPMSRIFRTYRKFFEVSCALARKFIANSSGSPNVLARMEVHADLVAVPVHSLRSLREGTVQRPEPARFRGRHTIRRDLSTSSAASAPRSGSDSSTNHGK